jgi:hypothetical protein
LARRRITERSTAISNSERDRILEELLSLERQASDAMIKGDKAALESILREDFSMVTDGRIYTRADFMNMRIRGVSSYSFENLDMTLDGDTAILKGTMIFVSTVRRGVVIKQVFKDTFAKRNGRFLFTKSEQTTVK